ncbi:MULTISPECIES: 50S ribosomal protein L29 [Desulfovibrionaceae]|uniref:Large ribosomal subunit protein uL29 n=1 Tax=Maridesulfovibrio salexigens (strain ATCC 14822 / DSM 2638 / NCIMB 8403 / VKM B-1763) TaxID=526222 RepID=RL29_MARSD|nr:MULTISPECIES: 50S ribosomal protein L29 [Desulfovibrionaceae]C6C193.1 RecName: Full=Large ribosomal subunit protein uL29; AltName: Full=50S ribosomal protein L29 [Maridesulfovibrio salexigens DSM 2638]ACS79256.1 ribosomal protein L29 [Maridesulfovibrio salexigens DSM 2638]NDV28291.1 50S ribosomal protein L29 [Desulfovibrio sp. JC010]HAS88943.1 50S ribosomal protein L29 [Desulfovibrio sp.]
MKAKELRELDNAALNEKLAEARQELFNLRFQHATAQLENTQRLSDVKKDIAKILTVQREKELGA